MMHIFCPQCGSKNMVHIAEAYYRCESCGYEGDFISKRGVFVR